ncbi:hypothetical protein GOODEAATRI_022618 [Goodea atripinnis]|uniref:Uncharacterized protein n=1 Tax=Goodea atripinnis TaxID=208336 RepID=A0ABV0MKA8_9TELE
MYSNKIRSSRWNPCFIFLLPLEGQKDLGVERMRQSACGELRTSSPRHTFDAGFEYKAPISALHHITLSPQASNFGVVCKHQKTPSVKLLKFESLRCSHLCTERRVGREHTPRDAASDGSGAGEDAYPAAGGQDGEGFSED